MATLPIFDLDEVRKAVGMSIAITSARRAFSAAETRETVTPSSWHLEVPEVEGEVHVKGAHVVGESTFVVKTATGFPGNAGMGIPTSTGYTTVFQAATGEPLALLLDQGYLTELRTGAAGGLLADLFTEPDLDTVAVVGTGGQARFQIEGLLAVRSPQRIQIVGRSSGSTESLAAWTREHTEADVIATQDVAAAVASSQLVVTVTNSRAPLFAADDVRPGTHITAVGADSVGKRELPPALLSSVSVVAVDDVDQSVRYGELQGVSLEELNDVTTIGALVVAGGRRERQPDEITVADIGGIGLQDWAVAQAALIALQVQL